MLTEIKLAPSVLGTGLTVVPPLFRPTTKLESWKVEKLDPTLQLSNFSTSVEPALARRYRCGPDRLLPVSSGDGIGAQIRTGSHQAFDFAQATLILW